MKCSYFIALANIYSKDQYTARPPPGHRIKFVRALAKLKCCAVFFNEAHVYSTPAYTKSPRGHLQPSMPPPYSPLTLILFQSPPCTYLFQSECRVKVKSHSYRNCSLDALHQARSFCIFHHFNKLIRRLSPRFFYQPRYSFTAASKPFVL